MGVFLSSPFSLAMKPYTQISVSFLRTEIQGFLLVRCPNLRYRRRDHHHHLHHNHPAHHHFHHQLLNFAHLLYFLCHRLCRRRRYQQFARNCSRFAVHNQCQLPPWEHLLNLPLMFILTDICQTTN